MTRSSDDPKASALLERDQQAAWVIATARRLATSAREGASDERDALLEKLCQAVEDLDRAEAALAIATARYGR